jgi:hypothetical protein
MISDHAFNKDLFVEDYVYGAIVDHKIAVRIGIEIIFLQTS